jgi:multiple antibiotic resistance protein
MAIFGCCGCSAAGVGSFMCGCFRSLWSAANPLSIAVLFFAMGGRHSDAQRRAMIRTSGFVALSMIVIFALFGRQILSVLGTEIPSLRIACGALLVSVGLSMLLSDEPPEQTQRDGVAFFDRARPNWSIVPLAVPMIASPDALSAAINCAASVGTACEWVSLLLAVALLMVCIVILLSIANFSSRYCGNTLPKLFFRIAGLVVLSIALQMILVGLSDIETLSCIMHH